jgi:hypothetical protein
VGGFPSGRRRRALALLAGGVAALAVGSASASGADGIGYDVGFPQCGGAFPSGAAFSIVGVNSGLPFSPNPCLGNGATPSELAWAGMNAQLYANTADPGPALSSHWPNGQTAPQECNTAAAPGADTAACHYDYGWNAAADSYAAAVGAYVSLGWAPAGAARTPVANAWWLDVEEDNTWTSNRARNVAALQGAVAFLTSVGAASVGFTASLSAWATITADTTAFTANPSWVPGASSLEDAQSRCAGPGFTGGPVVLVQFPDSGFDGDYSCAAAPVISLSGPAASVAGRASGALVVRTAQPQADAVSVAVKAASASGRLSRSGRGPGSRVLTLTIAPGATSSGTFFYRDTKAGTQRLTATAAGATPAPWTIRVGPAALARISISPATSSLRVQGHRLLTARGTDRYRNSLPIRPRWSVVPALGRLSSKQGTRTSFVALSPGRAAVTARVGRVRGVAAILVRR